MRYWAIEMLKHEYITTKIECILKHEYITTKIECIYTQKHWLEINVLFNCQG